MGSLCSKPGTHSGGHTVLPSSSSSGANNTQRSARLGGGDAARDVRSAAADAAERRMKAAQARGTHASNPKQGQLAANAAKPVKFTPTPKEEPRLVWD